MILWVRSLKVTAAAKKTAKISAMTDKRKFLVEALLKSNGVHDLSAEEEKVLCTLRYEEVEKPVIFVGAGTCGLGAGADKTLMAVSSFLENSGIDAEIIETGCIGL